MAFLDKLKGENSKIFRRRKPYQKKISNYHFTTIFVQKKPFLSSKIPDLTLNRSLFYFDIFTLWWRAPKRTKTPRGANFIVCTPEKIKPHRYCNHLKFFMYNRFAILELRFLSLWDGLCLAYFLSSAQKTTRLTQQGSPLEQTNQN